MGGLSGAKRRFQAGGRYGDPSLTDLQGIMPMTPGLMPLQGLQQGLMGARGLQPGIMPLQGLQGELRNLNQLGTAQQQFAQDQQGLQQQWEAQRQLAQQAFDQQSQQQAARFLAPMGARGLQGAMPPMPPFDLQRNPTDLQGIMPDPMPPMPPYVSPLPPLQGLLPMPRGFDLQRNPTDLQRMQQPQQLQGLQQQLRPSGIDISPQQQALQVRPLSREGESLQPYGALPTPRGYVPSQQQALQRASVLPLPRDYVQQTPLQRTSVSPLQQNLQSPQQAFDQSMPPRPEDAKPYVPNYQGDLGRPQLLPTRLSQPTADETSRRDQVLGARGLPPRQQRLEPRRRSFSPLQSPLYDAIDPQYNAIDPQSAIQRSAVPTPPIPPRGWQVGGQLEEPVYPVERELADESPWYPDEEVGYEAEVPMQGGFDIFGRAGG